MQKKGAIEFSMTTIMVIIIGVVVLALALAWVRGTFKDISGITEEAFEGAKEQLRAELTSQDPLGISPSTLSLKSGESTTVAVGFLNGLSPAKDITTAVISVTDPNSIIGVTVDGGVKTITSGEIFNWRIIIKATGSSGQSTVASVKVTSDDITREKPLVINIV